MRGFPRSCSMRSSAPTRHLAWSDGEDQDWVVGVGADLVLTSSSTGTSRPRKSSTALDTRRFIDTSRSVAASRRRACRDSLSRTAVVTLGSWLRAPCDMVSP